MELQPHLISALDDVSALHVTMELTFNLHCLPQNSRSPAGVSQGSANRKPIRDPDSTLAGKPNVAMRDIAGPTSNRAQRRAVERRWRTVQTACEEVSPESAFMDNLVDSHGENYVTALV